MPLFGRMFERRLRGYRALGYTDRTVLSVASQYAGDGQNSDSGECTPGAPANAQSVPP